MLVISQEQVRSLLPMSVCIDLMATTLEALARGEAVQPLRSATWLPDRTGLIGLMPGVLADPDVMGVKVLSVFPGNESTRFESHQGAVMLFETRHGQPLALVEASALTGIRTAAVSAVATRALARKDASRLAILGTGAQAISHFEAMCAVRSIADVRIWGRTPAHADRFAEECARQVATVAVATVAEAVRDADIICTVSGAREPILEGVHLSRGAHINAVGACVPSTRELDSEAVRRARLFVDRRESAENEAGEYLIPCKEGVIGPDHLLGELGEVLTGRVSGRDSGDDITMFKSLGLAVEDLSAAHYVYTQAQSRGVGVTVPLGGYR